MWKIGTDHKHRKSYRDADVQGMAEFNALPSNAKLLNTITGKIYTFNQIKHNWTQIQFEIKSKEVWLETERKRKKIQSIERETTKNNNMQNRLDKVLTELEDFLKI